MERLMVLMYLQVALTAIFLPLTLSACTFPESYKSKIWTYGALRFDLSELVLREYGDIIRHFKSDNFTFTLARYACGSMATSGSVITYSRSIDGSTNQAKCVMVEQHPEGFIVLREKDSGNPNANATYCSSIFTSSDTMYGVSVPGKSVVDTVTSQNVSFTSTLTNLFPFPTGTYRWSYSIDETTKNVCEGSSSSVMAISGNTLTFTSCKQDHLGEFPLSGIMLALARPSSSVFGESPAKDNVLIVEWYRAASNLRHFYCVRYSMTTDKIYLSFDVTTPMIMSYCDRNAQPEWYGAHGSHKYLLITLDRKTFEAATTTQGPTTTTSTTTSTTTTPTTVTTESTTPTTVPTTTPMSQTTPAVRTEYYQFALSGVKYDDINDKKAFVDDLQDDIASASAVSKDKITDLVIQKGTDGSPVITFQIKPGDQQTTSSSVIAFSRFKRKADPGTYTMTIQNNKYNVSKNSVTSWESTDPCPTTACTQGEICWILQNANHDCLGSYPSQPQSSTNQKTFWVTTTIIVISVVCAVVFLLLIVLIIVCIIRSGKQKKPGSEKSEERPYMFHRGTPERYNTGEIGQFDSGRGSTQYGTGITENT